MTRLLASVFTLAALTLGVAIAAESKETQGTLQSVSSDTLTMTDKDGKSQSYQTTKTTQITLTEKDKDARNCKLADLQKDDQLAVTYTSEDGKNTASKIKATRK